MLNRNPEYLHRKIQYQTQNFDRNFDNTVVDTYAFDKVLHSKAFSDFLFSTLKQTDSLSEPQLTQLIEQTGLYMINEVEEIYAKTQHRVVGESVYYAYISRLLSRICV